MSSSKPIGLSKRDRIEIDLGMKTDNALEEKERWANMTPEEMVNDQIKYLIRKYGKDCTEDALKSACNALKKKIENNKVCKISLTKTVAITAMERGIFEFYKNQGKLITNGNGINGNSHNDSIDSKVKKSPEVNNKDNGEIVYGIEVFKYIIDNLNGKATHYLKDRAKVEKVNKSLQSKKFANKEEALESFIEYIDCLIEDDKSKDQIKAKPKSVYDGKTTEQLINEANNLLVEYYETKKNYGSLKLSEENIDLNQAKIEVGNAENEKIIKNIRSLEKKFNI